MAVSAPHIGELRSIIRFETNDPNVLGAGMQDDYATLLTTRGKLTKLSGRRAVEGMAVMLNSDYRLIVRLQEALTLNNRIRVVIDNRYFTIDSIEKIDQKRFYYSLDLSEQE